MSQEQEGARSAVRWALWGYVPAAVLLAAVAGAALISNTTPSRFTRDPAVILDAHPLIGIVSNVGVVVWAATAAVTLFTALVLRMRGDDRRAWRFLLGAGLLTCWLMLDDLFLFHEWLFPEVLGVRTRFLFAAYVGVTGFFLFRFAALIRRTAYPLLVLSLGFFATSVGLDVLPEAWFRQNDWLYLIEDSGKLFGIVGWFAYFGSVSTALLERHVSVPGAGAPS